MVEAQAKTHADVVAYDHRNGFIQVCKKATCHKAPCYLNANKTVERSVFPAAVVTKDLQLHGSVVTMQRLCGVTDKPTLFCVLLPYIITCYPMNTVLCLCLLKLRVF